MPNSRSELAATEKPKEQVLEELRRQIREFNGQMRMNGLNLENLSPKELKTHEDDLEKNFKTLDVMLKAKTEAMAKEFSKSRIITAAMQEQKALLETTTKVFEGTRRVHASLLRAIELMLAIKTESADPAIYMAKVEAARQGKPLTGKQKEIYEQNLRELVVQPLKTALTDLRNLKEKQEGAIAPKQAEAIMGKIKQKEKEIDELMKAREALLDKLPEAIQAEINEVREELAQTKEWGASDAIPDEWKQMRAAPSSTKDKASPTSKVRPPAKTSPHKTESPSWLARAIAKIMGSSEQKKHQARKTTPDSKHDSHSQSPSPDGLS